MKLNSILIALSLQSLLIGLNPSMVQVTNEKVKALMEMAQLKQELHLLQEYDFFFGRNISSVTVNVL